MRPFFARLCLACLLSLIGSCGARLVDAPPAPAGAQDFLSPTYTVPAGSDLMTCLTIRVDNSEAIYVRASQVYQSPGGHHALVMAIDDSPGLSDAPHACGEQDWRNSSLRFVGLGASGGGVGVPDGVGIRIPAHARLLLQSHYINTTAAPINAQDLVRLQLVDAAAVTQVAGAFSMDATHFTIAPHATGTATFACHPPAAMTIPWMFPHMHEHGTHATLRIVHGDGTVLDVYDADWSPGLRDHFPVVEFASPLHLDPTDRIETTCTWDNAGDTPIVFPVEMCAAFMAFYPSDGALWTCDDDGVNVLLGM